VIADVCERLAVRDKPVGGLAEMKWVEGVAGGFVVVKQRSLRRAP